MLEEKAEINYKTGNRERPEKEAAARKISFEMEGLCYQRRRDGKTWSTFAMDSEKQK